MTLQRLRDTLLRKRVKAVEQAWQAAREGDPVAVHQLRVASRRIREVLPVISDEQRPQRLKRMQRKVRRLTRTLGPVREHDVSLRLLAALEEDHPEGRPAIEIVREAVAHDRHALHAELEKHLDTVTLDKFVKKMTRVVGQGKKAQNNGQRSTADQRRWQLVVAARVVRRAKQLRQAVEHAGALYTPDRLHNVRVSTKKLRYALEVGNESKICRWHSAIRSLKEIQDILGQLHDREALLARVRDVHISYSNTSTSPALDQLTRVLEDETRHYHAEFVRRHDRLLKLCATVRQQATEALPIGRPTPKPVTLRQDQRLPTPSGSQGSKGTDGMRRDKAGRDTPARRASAR
jgi:CHAD domain-containing protein